MDNKLFESPDGFRLQINGKWKKISYDDKKYHSYSFAVWVTSTEAGKMWIGERNEDHGFAPYGTGGGHSFSGRVWPKLNIISIWTPPDVMPEKVKHAKIYITKLFDFLTKEGINVKTYQFETWNWNNRDDYDKFAFYDDFMYELDKSIDFEKKFQEQENELKMNESPDYLNTPINGNIVTKNDQEHNPWSFGYIDDQLYIGNGMEHQDIPGVASQIPEGQTYKDIMKFSGTLWGNLKIISFWEPPLPQEFLQIATEISHNIKQNILTTKGWKIEIFGNKKYDKENRTFYDHTSLMELILVKDYINHSNNPKRIEPIDRIPSKFSKPPSIRNNRTKRYNQIINNENYTANMIAPEQLIKNIISEILFETRLTESVEDQEVVDFIYDKLYEDKLLHGEPITVPELRELLKKQIINFEFIKLDGEVRPAKGTTMMSRIPKKNHPKGIKPASDKVASFWDLSKDEWRSVSNRSKEIVIVRDPELGDEKVIVSDKKPKTDEPIKPTASKPGVPTPRPLPEPIEPIVRPTVMPDEGPSIPRVEDIPEPDDQDDPLDIKDPNVIADDVKDKEIIAPRSLKPDQKLQPKPEVHPETILQPKPEIPSQNEINPEDDIDDIDDDDVELV